MPNRATTFFKNNQHQILPLKIGGIIFVAGIQKTYRSVRVDFIFAFQVKKSFVSFIVGIKFFF